MIATVVSADESGAGVVEGLAGMGRFARGMEQKALNRITAILKNTTARLRQEPSLY